MKKTDMYATEVRRLQALNYTRKAMATTLGISPTRLHQIIAKIRVDELHAQYLAAREALYNGGGAKILRDEVPIEGFSQVKITPSERTAALYAAIKREPHRYYGLVLSEMAFDVRLDNILKNECIYNLGDLLSRSDIETLPRMGEKTFNELLSILALCGLHLNSLKADWFDTHWHLNKGTERAIIAPYSPRISYNEITDTAILCALIANEKKRLIAMQHLQAGDPDALEAMAGLRRVVSMARRLHEVSV